MLVLDYFPNPPFVPLDCIYLAIRANVHPQMTRHEIAASCREGNYMFRTGVALGIVSCRRRRHLSLGGLDGTSPLRARRAIQTRARMCRNFQTDLGRGTSRTYTNPL